jgi:branched-chain amino acid transport system substrate-binding protein
VGGLVNLSKAVTVKRSSVATIITVLATLVLRPSCFAQSRESVKIGALLCQTGNCSDWGSAALKGAVLAQERVNSSGGIFSRPIELIAEDSSESISGTQAVTAFQSLLQRNLHFFIGPSWSPAALAIAPIAARRSDIVVITPSASAREFSRTASHLFNVRPPEELATRALARYVFNQGKRSVAIFSSQQSAESAQGKIFEDEFKKLGGIVTIRIEPVPTQTDLRTEAIRLVKTSPQSIFFMNYNQIETGIKALNSLGYKGMRLAISIDDARVSSSKGLLEGFIISRAAEPTEEFRSAFRQRFGEAPGLSAEGGYDAVMLLVQALNQAGDFDVRRVKDKLQQGSYSGAIGAFTFDQNREVVQAPELFVVRNGKLKRLSK